MTVKQMAGVSEKRLREYQKAVLIHGRGMIGLGLPLLANRLAAAMGDLVQTLADQSPMLVSIEEAIETCLYEWVLLVEEFDGDLTQLATAVEDNRQNEPLTKLTIDACKICGMATPYSTGAVSIEEVRDDLTELLGRILRSLNELVQSMRLDFDDILAKGEAYNA